MMDMTFKIDKMNIIFVMDKMVMMDLRDRSQEASNESTDSRHNLCSYLLLLCIFHISHIGFVVPTQLTNTKVKISKTSLLSRTIN